MKSIVKNTAHLLSRNILSTAAVITLIWASAFAAVPAGWYQPWATLDPDCAPWDIDCVVQNVWTETDPLRKFVEWSGSINAVYIGWKVWIGTDNPLGVLSMEVDADDWSDWYVKLSVARDSSYWWWNHVTRSRWTHENKIALQENDLLSYNAWSWYDWINYRPSAVLNTYVDQVVSTWAVSWAYSFDTYDNWVRRDVMDIRSSGYVWIWTRDPQFQLDIAWTGRLRVQNDGQYWSYVNLENTTTANSWQIAHTWNSWAYDDDLRIIEDLSDTRFVIKQWWNVWIGTSAPRLVNTTSKVLTIDGWDAKWPDIEFIWHNVAASASPHGRIMFVNNVWSTPHLTSMIGGYWNSTGQDAWDLRFYTKSASWSIAQAMHISSEWKVWIGISNPHTWLDVWGTHSRIWLRWAPGWWLPTTAWKWIKFEYSIWSDRGNIIAYDYTNGVWKNLSIQWAWWDTFLNAWSGNVWIWTFVPTEKLEVNWSLKIVDWNQEDWALLTSDASWKWEWKESFSKNVITASVPSNQTLTGTCEWTPATVTIPKDWLYSIRLDASAYLYSWTYNNLYIRLLDSTWGQICRANATLPTGTTAWYFFPGTNCIEELFAWNYTINVWWSNASTCAGSTINRVFSWTTRIRLLHEY